jgi:hypothetical protein
LCNVRKRQTIKFFVAVNLFEIFAKNIVVKSNIWQDIWPYRISGKTESGASLFKINSKKSRAKQF